ncbi:unnamed protein product [Ectocarpus sp. 8 AP-2014]
MMVAIVLGTSVMIEPTVRVSSGSRGPLAVENSVCRCLHWRFWFYCKLLENCTAKVWSSVVSSPAHPIWTPSPKTFEYTWRADEPGVTRKDSGQSFGDTLPRQRLHRTLSILKD